MPLVASSPAAALVLFALVVGWTLAECWIAARSAGAARSAPFSAAEVAIAVVTVVVAIAAMAMPSVLPSTVVRPPELAFAAGAALAVVGVAVRVAAAATLGGHYTLSLGTQPGQAVCDAGLYRWVRHPGYAGTVVALCGLALALGSWAGVLAIGLLVPALALRIRSEERMLERSLGEPYARYRRATRWRFIPGLI